MPEEENKEPQAPAEPRKKNELKKNLILVGVILAVNLILLCIFYFMIMLPAQKLTLSMP